ncbi:MAG: BatA domain-containing protein, partial [Verrucomicrobiota bacterium]
MLGALAVAAPIIFHLIRRTTKERVTFSSLMFLAPTPPRVTRRNRLENIWLLLLRCMVIGLLAIGFARPFLNQPTAVDLAKGAGRNIVVLVDTSASMRREGLWREAVERVESVLRGVNVTDSVAIYSFSQRAEPLVTFEQWTSMEAGERVAMALRRLRDASPSWSGTRLGDAVVTAMEALEDVATREKQDVSMLRRQVVVISDFQDGSHLERLQGYDWPKNVEVVAERLKVKRPTNAGLQLVAEGEDGVVADEDAGPRVRVTNSTESKREQFRVGWAGFDGKVIVGKPLEVYVPPGQSRVFQLGKKPEGAGERLILTGDDHDFDNVVFHVPPKAEKITVLYLGNEPAQDSAQLLYYLTRAFQQTRRRDVQVVAKPEGQAVSATELSNA